MKVLILALLAIRALTVATYLAGELSSIQNSNPTVSYLMAYDLSILEKKNACLSSIKGQTGNDIPLAVKVFYDFMRTAYFVNLLSYDEDKNKGNNVFGNIMKTMKVDIKETASAQNPGAKKNTSCNHLDLHKIAKEKLKDFCNVNFKDIETALAAELKAANNFQKECPDKINQMFAEIKNQYQPMTTFSAQFLDKLDLMLRYQFLATFDSYITSTHKDGHDITFIMIFEMIKYEQKKGQNQALLSKYNYVNSFNQVISEFEVEFKKDEYTQNIGIEPIKKSLEGLINIVQNTDEVTKKSIDTVTKYLTKTVDGRIVLI